MEIKTKRLTFLGLMIGYSLALYILETYIPNPLIAIFPGAKLGLTNIITLICLMMLGVKDTFIIVTVRVILSSMFAGSLSYLMFSIGGSYLSLALMYFCNKIKEISTIGVSIVGAIGHNIGQLLVASIIISNIDIIGYLPFMLMASLITGVFIGIVCKYTSTNMVKIVSKYY